MNGAYQYVYFMETISLLLKNAVVLKTPIDKTFQCVKTDLPKPT